MASKPSHFLKQTRTCKWLFMWNMVKPSVSMSFRIAFGVASVKEETFNIHKTDGPFKYSAHVDKVCNERGD